MCVCGGGTTLAAVCVYWSRRRRPRTCRRWPWSLGERTVACSSKRRSDRTQRLPSSCGTFPSAWSQKTLGKAFNKDLDRSWKDAGEGWKGISFHKSCAKSLPYETFLPGESSFPDMHFKVLCLVRWSSGTPRTAVVSYDHFLFMMPFLVSPLSLKLLPRGRCGRTWGESSLLLFKHSGGCTRLSSGTSALPCCPDQAKICFASQVCVLLSV